MGRRLLLGVGRGARASAFSPSDVTGLVLWLDASEGTYQSTGGSAALADGDPVGEWQDQSGEGNDATQTTGAAKPVLKTGANGLNGLPVLRFDGTDDCLFAAFTLAQPAQVFIVYKLLAIGTSGYNDGIFDGGAGWANMALLADNTPRTVLFAGVSLIYTANVCDGAFGQVTALFNGASSVLREDGTARATGDVGSADPGGLTVGALTTGGRCTNIDVAEILVYDSALSDTDREAVEAYLTDRYGL